jgi:hypothetical protein
MFLIGDQTETTQGDLVLSHCKDGAGDLGSNRRRPAWENDIKLTINNIAFLSISFWRLSLPRFHSGHRESAGVHEAEMVGERAVAAFNRLSVAVLVPQRIEV